MIRRFCIVALAVAAVCAAGLGNARAGEEEELFREAVVDGPTDLVWRLLTTKKGMQAWLAPQADVDWRPGGLIRTHHDVSGRIGDGQTTVSRIVSTDAGRRFTVKVVQAPEGYPIAQFVEGTWYDVALDALPGDRTRIRLVGHGLGEGWARYATAPMFQQSADLAFGQLKKAIAARAPAKRAPAPKPAPKVAKKSPPKRTP
jgi:uncharacterized protein YndB with AHSA1/START domain